MNNLILLIINFLGFVYIEGLAEVKDGFYRNTKKEEIIL